MQKHRYLIKIYIEKDKHVKLHYKSKQLTKQTSKTKTKPIN
jgi:hypothetical protein